MARCPRPGGAGACARGRGAGWSRAGSTPTRHRRSTPAAAPGSPCAGGRQRTSAGWGIEDQFCASPQCFDPDEEGGRGRWVWPHLDLHALGLDDVDLVLVAAPDFVVHHGHAADGVMRPAEVHEVVVGQVPLAICPQEPHK